MIVRGAHLLLLAGTLLAACAAPARAPDPVPERPIDAGAGSLPHPPVDAALADAALPDAALPDAGEPTAAPSCHQRCKRDVVGNRPCGHWEQLGPRQRCSGRPCPSRPPRWIECDPRCCDAPN